MTLDVFLKGKAPLPAPHAYPRLPKRRRSVWAVDKIIFETYAPQHVHPVGGVMRGLYVRWLSGEWEVLVSIRNLYVGGVVDEHMLKKAERLGIDPAWWCPACKKPPSALSKGAPQPVCSCGTRLVGGGTGWPPMQRNQKEL